jgi:ubiquinone/menaquinone biosynthesis C-methylase UbiE
VSEDSYTIVDKEIQKFFDKEAKDWVDEHDTDGLPKSAKIQIDQLLKSKPLTCIDVGSGPGTVLIELLNNGLKYGIGIDLSAEMCYFARLRLKDRGLEDRVEILNKNFLEYTPEKTIEAISMHRVLCCYPDREKFLDKTIEIKPNVISLTIPVDWIIMRWPLNLFLRIKNAIFPGFRPYIHKHSDIKLQMKENGYVLSSIERNWYWVVMTFQSTANSSDIGQ